MANQKNHSGTEDFHTVHNRIKRGDIIGVLGIPGKSNTGELSVRAVNIEMLSYCLHMLPT